MIFNKALILLIVLTSFHIGFTESKEKREYIKLQVYEDNTIGYTWDDNDVGYMDFTLSQMYPIMHNGKPKEDKARLKPSLYFAFTGRFAQYIGTRDSSPVIGKKFNPKLFVRWWLGQEQKYLDIGYAHESNGQSINNGTAYQNERNEFMNKMEDPEFARDNISRGWDYLNLKFRRGYRISDYKFSGLLNLKYFLNQGALQGDKEEYNSWENRPSGLARKYVDGISFDFDFSTNFKSGDNFRGTKISLKYKTGYRDTFQRNTFRLEGTFKVFKIPVMLWVSNGYNSDLIDYYEKVDSFGINFLFHNFLNEI